MELRIVRRTDHFDEACRFWGDLLGWPVTREWPADEHQGQGRIFGYGDVARVEFIETADVAPVTGVSVGIEHTDVDELHERMVAAGITVTQPPTDQPWGHRNVAVEDPSGLAVTFFEWR
jgi:uncharacterized glyoxalase superfamily protein PhnB